MLTASISEVTDGTIGRCTNCHAEASGVEPDARGYKCDSCGQNTVYGLEELLIMGQLEIDDPDDDATPMEMLENFF